MILTALYEYYQALAQKGEAPVPGWGNTKVSFHLSLDGEGNLLDVVPTTDMKPRGKKMVPVPKEMPLPQGVIRTANPVPNFLWDNAVYLLGLPKKNPKRDMECFRLSSQLHRQLLGELEHPAARAVCRFFEKWQPEKAPEHPALLPYLEELAKGGNLVFRVEGQYLHELPEVQAVWNNHSAAPSGDAVTAQCLVTGKQAPIARLHASIKGVRGAQASGAALVSFNAPAFTSYGKEQSFNAPVSEEAAFAYTTALNTLLADEKHIIRLGDTTVVFWAQTAEPAYPDFFAYMMNPDQNETFREEDLTRGMDAIRQGIPFRFEEVELSPDAAFYVLGLAPNAARLSVRFFYLGTFGALSQNVLRHYGRLEIVRPQNAPLYLSPWALIRETANPNPTEKAPPNTLVGAVMRSIWEDLPYPATLFSTILLRIRADHKVTWKRAAILKAWLQKNRPENRLYQEAADMKLNDDTQYLPYLLGRLFSLLENIQEAAVPGLNATIKDRYFNSAGATPAAVFPLLLRLEQNHMKVLRRDKPGLAITLERQLQELMGRIQETFPSHLNQEDQGTFILGYYHQTQKRWKAAL